MSLHERSCCRRIIRAECKIGILPDKEDTQVFSDILPAYSGDVNIKLNCSKKMHFSIPDTEEVKQNGSEYVVYNLHINGMFHCSVRYRQLLSLHQQLYKEFGASTLPPFPPKRFLSLTPVQIEERRLNLEKYVLQLSQDARVLNSDIFNGWLVWAQNETQHINGMEEVVLDVYLMNGQKFNFKVSPTLQTNDLLEKVCRHIHLPKHLIYYFSLYLMKLDNRDFTIVKALQDFESPYISQKCSRMPLKIVLRKSYWNLNNDFTVAEDKVGLNLLYIQTMAEIEKGWISASKDIMRRLAAFQARGAKMEYLRLAQTLKFYGYTHFQKCTCDFPEENTPVLVSAGNKELNIRIRDQSGVFKEGSFRVTRMRCWRISSIKEPVQSVRGNDGYMSSLELSFEYLMSKDEMRWIKLRSPQAVLISLCLQGMVQELLGNKRGGSLRASGERIRKGSLSYMKRDGTSMKVILNHTGEPLPSDTSTTSPIGELSLRRLSERLSELSFRDGHRNSELINLKFYHAKIFFVRVHCENSCYKQEFKILSLPQISRFIHLAVGSVMEPELKTIFPIRFYFSIFLRLFPLYFYVKYTDTVKVASLMQTVFLYAKQF
ncbi:Sorting nexin-17 [Armadillidium nasatum]|uniref:Sorting nexin-17 n=1 Tax=Armadillidium nasatum TaxID=96803 RepID=A0A5N5SXC2_9CRUS|nr:Sorting nexin-17 [Armadillidium nasatum]